MLLKRILASFVLVAMLPTLAFSQDLLKLEELMSADELQSTGVGELGAAQLEALNLWIQNHRVPVEQAVSGKQDLNNQNHAANIGAVVPAQVAGEETLGERAELTATNQSQASIAISREYGEREAWVDIESVINGVFSGWSGTTVFELANGQVYQQRRQGKWRTDLLDPQVKISKNFLGMLEMEVAGRSIGVKRLRSR